MNVFAYYGIIIIRSPNHHALPGVPLALGFCESVCGLLGTPPSVPQHMVPKSPGIL